MYFLKNRTDNEILLDELEQSIGAKNYKYLWRFFKFICGKPKLPYTEWEQHLAYCTNDSVE